MSSIGSGNSSNTSPQDLIYQDIAARTADAEGPVDSQTGDSQAKSAPKGKAGGAVAKAPAPSRQTGVTGGVQKDQVVAPKPGSSAAQTQPTTSLPAVDVPSKTSIQKTDITALKGLASQGNSAQAAKQVQAALVTLTTKPTVNDDKYKQALTDFVAGMQSMGRMAQTAGALRTLIGGTSDSPAEVAHKEALAGDAGVQVAADTTAAATAATTPSTGSTATLAQANKAAATDSTTSTAPSAEVQSAQDQLSQDLASGTADSTTIQSDVAAYKDAMAAAGQAQNTGAQLATLLAAPGVSATGQGSALAAAALLGIAMPSDSKGQADDARIQATQDATARAAAKAQAAAQQKAAADAAAAAAAQQEKAAQQSSSNGSAGGGSSGSSGGTSGTSGSSGGVGGSGGGVNSSGVGQTGDISNLAQKTGAVAGNFKIGVLPDYDNGSSGGVAGFVARTGVRPSQSGGYVNANADGSFDTAAADRWIQDAATNKVPVVSLSISSYGTGPLSTAQVQGIKDAVAKGRALGLEVDIRFGYEMNYAGGGGTQGDRVNDHNNPAAFKEQWAQVAAVVNPDRNSTPPAHMVWSPNVASGGTLPYADWLPSDPSTIDQVGLDYYHKSGDPISVASISTVMDPIYAIAKKLNVPFIFGETGVTSSGDNGAEKMKWYDLITSPELRAKYPLYQGAQWFDYVKGGTNFSLSQDPSMASQYRDAYDKTFNISDTGSTTPSTSSTN